jgi:hypothetical protein
MRVRAARTCSCEEWPKNPDNELESTTIYERLISEGVAVSENALRDVLIQLARDKDITLVLGDVTLGLESTPPLGTGMTIRAVSSELCASSTAHPYQ